MIISFGRADVAQSVERRLGKAEVTGSIPVISLKNPRRIILRGFCCVDSEKPDSERTRVFGCADHSGEPVKAKIVFGYGLHDF